MPIIKSEDGKDVIVQFGTGDIFISHGAHIEPEISHLKELILSESDVPHEIGSFIPAEEFERDWKGKRTSEIDRYFIRLQFSGPESVRVLIEELEKIEREYNAD